MADDINAYARVEPLLNDYDHELHKYVDLCNRAQLRGEGGLLPNIKPLRHRHNSDVCRNASGMIELVGQINAVMKKEVSVIRAMSSLPEKEHRQVQFWREEFVPLLAQTCFARNTSGGRAEDGPGIDIALRRVRTIGGDCSSGALPSRGFELPACPRLQACRPHS
jgi:hypothetical protein